MVGEETEIKTLPDATDRSPKGMKKCGLINSFFKPVVKSKENTESKSETETSASVSSDDDGNKKDNAEIILESNQSGLFEQKEKCSNSKSYPDNELSSQEEHVGVKSKQTKAKSSITCSVQNASNILSSSGSEFEDDGRSLLTAKSKERQKCRKNNEKAGKGSEFGAQEVEGKNVVNDGEKAVKKPRTLVKKGKKGTGTGGNCTRSSEQSGQDKNKNVDGKERESRSVGNYQSNDSNKTSVEPAFDQHIELKAEQNSEENEARDALRSKGTTVIRTSAFDVLMKSQRAQKTDSHSTESTPSEALQSDAIPCDTVEDNSCSCEITDVKENLQSKETASCQSKSLTEESSSDKSEIDSSHRTNAFDFLMKKGKFVNSPCTEDSQAEMELESDATGDFEQSLKKKPKKKTFEFQLSIRASNKKDIEISFESESVSSDTCQEKAQEKSKKKKRKSKTDSMSAGEGKSDHSFVNEKSDEGDFCKSKKVGKKSKIKSKVKSKQDSADVSLLEEHSEEENKNEVQKKKRRSGRKSASNVGAMDLDSNYPDDAKEFEPAGKNVRKKEKYQGSNEENHGDIKGNSRRKRKAKRSDASASKKAEEKIELETVSDNQRETSGSRDPKPLAAIFLKKPAASSKTEITQENQAIGSPGRSASSSLTCPSNISTDAKDKQKTVDKELPRNKEKSAEEREAANRAFKALFTGASSQKAAPSVNVIEALPVDKELSHTSGKSTKQSVDKESTQSKETSAEEKEAANRAFKALFTGASSQKTATSVSVVEACPAPWPSVSHVLQKDEDFSSNESFWCLPWPVGKDCKFDVSLHCYLLSERPLDNAIYSQSPLITQNKVLHVAGHSMGNRPHMEKKTEQPSFPEAVIRKILSELALFYPGVPLRKLYKRYASKLEMYKASIESGENKQLALERKVPMDHTKKDEKLLESKEGLQEVNADSLPRKIGRGKRRLSSDGGVGQEKKIARKSGIFSATLPCKDQGLVGDQSARKSCKKRQREEDKDHLQEKACKGRRLSTRLQEKKQTCAEDKTVDNNVPQKLEMSSSRKKRKRTTDCDVDVTEVIHTVSKEQLTCAMPGAPTDSKSDKTVSVLSDALWTDLYRPVHSTEVMANASAVSKLRSWLGEWKVKREKTLRKELQQQKRLLAKQKNKASSSQTSSQTLEWWDADSDSDFQMSDGDSDDSDSEGIGLSIAMFISGPSGAGKTAMVYACADELGYKVFEVNSASKRSGKHILSQLEEATQSHLVTSNKPTTTIKGPVPESSFAGLFSKPEANSSCPSGPLGALFQQAGEASKSKEKKGVKGSKGKSVKEKKGKSRAKGKSILKQPSQSLSQDGTESNLSSKAASLILFEEVDVIFEEDKSFWMAVNSFMQNAKCPIVLISTESQVSCEGRYDQINVKCPSVNLLSAHLQLVGLMNNICINPEDLKSLVAHNNCDIRKSFLNLQFWSASRGGLKMPYKRPANLNDSSLIFNTNQTTQTSGHTRSAECVPTNSLSQDVPQSHPTMTGGVLDEGGEESMFLSLSDWQIIKSGGLRRSSRSSRSASLKPTEADNSDSDFCEPKRKTLVCADGSTDSVFEITDTNDSQPVNSDKRPDDSVQLPFMDGLLFESVLGLLNCLQQPAEGSLSALQKGAKPQDELQVRNIPEKLHLSHFSQVLGVNLTHANLSGLLPFFVDPSVSQQKEEVPDQSEAKESNSAPSDIAKDVTTKGENMFSGIFSDTSLFDDGTEPPIKITKKKEGIEKGLEEGLVEANKNAPSSQDSTDTGFSESQTKEETGESGEGQNHEMKTGIAVKTGSELVHRKPSQGEKLTSKALEIFAQCAESMSFADAYCPNLSNTQSNSARFGWWGAQLKPGLTDEHVTVEESSDWLACETRSSIRGALEVANLDDCFVKVKSLSEDLTETGKSPVEEITVDQTSTCKSVLCDLERLSSDFPPRDFNSVVRLDAVTQAQKSSTASRRKLYSCLSSCIPVLNHCNHCSVVCDYIPTFRLLCHSERLREAAHIKRRFLHYLDSNSFPINRATMDALADSYMVS